MIRRTRALLATLALAALVAACAPTSPERTNAELAVDSLERGVAAQNSGDNNAATIAYFEALSRDPRGPAASRAYTNLGQLARLAGKAPLAEGYYLEGLSIDDSQALAWFGLGAVRLNVANWAGSVEANQRAIALEPNNASAHYNMALALRQLGRNSEAQASFARAQQIDPRLTPPPTASPR